MASQAYMQYWEGRKVSLFLILKGDFLKLVRPNQKAEELDMFKETICNIYICHIV